MRDVVPPFSLNAFAAEGLIAALEEQYQAPRSWAERAYPNLIYYNQVDRGGHFAAWEQPRLFAEELRAAFKSLR
jgi:pimeloyl-ACP methyl ester carboxylesterase